MDREKLFSFFENKYISFQDFVPRLPLGLDPAKTWGEFLDKRKENAIAIDLRGVGNDHFWYVTTNKMITASEVIVEELFLYDKIEGAPELAPLEEVYHTSIVEGYQINEKEALKFLREGKACSKTEEQMLLNNRKALKFTCENANNLINEKLLKLLNAIISEGLGHNGFRASLETELSQLTGMKAKAPVPDEIKDRIKELTGFLLEGSIHPLIKAGTVQAWFHVVSPFQYGNGIVGRLLSDMILNRAGYGFFQEVSKSSLIAKDLGRYYTAIHNVLLPENGGDLTYFLDYYLELLAEAVSLRRGKGQENAIAAERDLAGSSLSPKNNFLKGFETIDLGEVIFEDEEDSEEVVDEAEESDEVEETKFEETAIGIEPRWAGEELCRKEIQRVLEYCKNQSTAAVYNKMLEFLEQGRNSFMVNDFMNEEIAKIKVQTAIGNAYGRKIIQKAGSKGTNSIYTFGIGKGEINNDAYGGEYHKTIETLALGTAREKRMAKALHEALPFGYIDFRSYERIHESDSWQEDMRLAEQIGLVKEITSGAYQLLNGLQPRLDRLDSGQKKKASEMYDKFGEDEFSLDMVVASLEYSSGSAGACLHQFTLLKILDCTEEEGKKYQFRVNPQDNPEVFEESA